jgi:hypothetical protein
VRFVLGLIGQSLDDVGAESRILVASFPSFFVFGSSAPGFRFFEAVKDINSNARRLRSPLIKAFSPSIVLSSVMRALMMR